MSKVSLEPLNQYNKLAMDHVAPSGWVNPDPKDKYDVLVIGGGSGGLVSAIGAKSLGVERVALIEKHLLGGDCLNFGCVPSKSLISSGKVFHSVFDSAFHHGISFKKEDIHVDFLKVMDRMFQLRSNISQHDSTKRLTGLGIDVFLGTAKFSSENSVEVDGKKIFFTKAIVASGSVAYIPPILGIENVNYLTNQTVFSLQSLPKNLVIIGAGPIGCELGQVFRRFGSQVTLLQSSSQFLPKEDRDAALLLEQSFKKEGIDCRFNTQIHEISQDAKTKIKKISFTSGKKQEMVNADVLLIATGRKPDLKGMGLHSASIQYDDRKWIIVDDYLQTTNSNVFAVGDVCSRYKFTHVSDFSARIAIQNALFFKSKKFSSLLIPWVTYTDPEIAHVGLYEEDAISRKIPIDTYTQDFKDVDRCVLDGVEGFVKIHVKKGTDKILGATIVGGHAGDMLSEITTAMQNNIGLSKISRVIHPYPTQAEAIRKIGDQYNRNCLTPFVVRLLKFWIKFKLKI